MKNTKGEVLKLLLPLLKERKLVELFHVSTVCIQITQRPDTQERVRLLAESRIETYSCRSFVALRWPGILWVTIYPLF